MHLAPLVALHLSVSLFLTPVPVPTATHPTPDLESLQENLHSPSPAKRRRAVRDLALLPHPSAWKLVLEHLDDREPEVADQAQLSLASIDSPDLVRALLGRDGLASRDEWIRRRAAETFGRMMTTIRAQDLLTKASRSDPHTTEMLLWSVERLASSRHLELDPKRTPRALIKIVDDRHPPQTRAQALCTLHAIDPNLALPALPSAANDRVRELRVAALHCAAEPPSTTAHSLALERLSDVEPSVRLAAAELLGSLDSRATLAPLIDRLEIEPRLRVRLRLVEILQDLSGMKYRLDPRQWRHWLSSLPEDWTPRRTGATTPSGSTVAFAGLPILSDRLCFLIDFSGSLWYEREGRPPRKKRVDALLRETLPRLSPETEFNLVPYTDRPHPWRDRLVPATPRNVRDALLDFEANTVRGKGNVFDAALLALEDPRVDRIVIFTDGAPTGGRRWNLELMMPLLAQAARFRGVAFDSIVVDAPPRLEKRWAELADRTGGLSIGVEL